MLIPLPLCFAERISNLQRSSPPKRASRNKKPGSLGVLWPLVVCNETFEGNHTLYPSLQKIDSLPTKDRILSNIALVNRCRKSNPNFIYLKDPRGKQIPDSLKEKALASSAASVAVHKVNRSRAFYNSLDPILLEQLGLTNYVNTFKEALKFGLLSFRREARSPGQQNRAASAVHMTQKEE